MDLKSFEDVLILLEEGNMTKAAARRNITQPAFSRRIRSFEDWLGVEILKRGANRVEISDALGGNEKEIRALIERMQDLKSRIARFDPARSTIAIAAQHGLIASVFSDIAQHVRRGFPAVRFRLRAGNQNDCVSMFLRGDVSMLLSYETTASGPMPFDSSVRREVWGTDQLIPVVGGQIRYLVQSDGSLPVDVPAVVYPANSYTGRVLRAHKSPFGTPEFAANPVCETAFSNGVLEMVKNGLGVGWLPHRICYDALERGTLVGLSQRFGSVPLKIALYSDAQDRETNLLQDYLGNRLRSQTPGAVARRPEA